MRLPKTPIRLLTVAGSDSGGGAGIQADLKTFQALGGFGMSVLTALTAQNTLGVGAVHVVPVDFVEAQFDHIAEDLGVDAVKTGMLFSSEVIQVTAASLTKHRLKNIVIDPVMLAKGGSKLLKASAVSALKDCLLPLASIVTPNIPEAETLTGLVIRTQADMEKAARILLRITDNVVIKGGHFDSSSVCPDLVATNSGNLRWLTYPRLSTRNTHGTGCTYSAAIAAYLGHGESIELAVDRAREYVQGALTGAIRQRLGKGCGPLDHNWNLKGHT